MSKAEPNVRDGLFVKFCALFWGLAWFVGGRVGEDCGGVRCEHDLQRVSKRCGRWLYEYVFSAKTIGMWWLAGVG